MAVACREGFTAVVREHGDLWALGKGNYGQLGLGIDADQLLPALVGGADEVFDGEAIVMVAAGPKFTACVTAKGTLWTLGSEHMDSWGTATGSRGSALHSWARRCMAGRWQ